MMLRILLVLLVMSCVLCARGQHEPIFDITIHTEDARATLLALDNPVLTHVEAMKVASMYGNQAVLRKLHQFQLTTTTQDFAEALYASAHGLPITTPNQRAILFFLVKPKTKQLLALVDKIESNPASFQALIEKRIAMFTPANAHLHLQGYVLAAGDGGGYAFGGTDFFLNIGIVDDLVLAQSVTTHEMYHAVQGAFASKREVNFSHAVPQAQQSCRNIEHLFSSLYEEGSAVYVADPSLIPQSHSAVATRMLADMKDGEQHIGDSATLLEMSVVSLSVPDPVSFEDVYSVGFFGHAVLYNIGYVMVKDIVAAYGPAGLINALQEPPYQLILHYAALPAYGKDKDHPSLGPNTLAAARRLADGCSQGSLN